MKITQWLGYVTLLQAWSPGTIQAATIEYSVGNLGGGSWAYSYTVSNDTLGAPLDEFTIYFDELLYENLAVTASPVNWDSLVVEPDIGLPDAGFFDSLAQGSGIPVSGSLGGFTVSFDFLGTGTPGPQPFDIVDPSTFAVLESGTTTVVPLPGGIWLALTAVGFLLPRVIGRRSGSLRNLPGQQQAPA